MANLDTLDTIEETTETTTEQAKCYYCGCVDYVCFDEVPCTNRKLTTATVAELLAR